MQKKHILMLCCALIALILIFVGVAAALLMDGDSYADLIEKGNRYLEQGDYENAILMYNRARGMDEGEEAAYHGLYLAYLRSGQNQNALAALNSGIHATGSSKFQQFLDELRADNGSLDNDNSDNNDSDPTYDEEQSENQGLALNIELMEFVANSNYGDYMLRYGYSAGTLSNESYTVHVDGMGATLIFLRSADHEIINPSTGTPNDEVMPDKVILDNATLMFYKNEATYAQLETLSGVSSPNLSKGAITFKYKDCQVTASCDANQTITATSVNSLVPTKRQVIPSTRVLVATIQDENTHQAISGAAVKVYGADGSAVGEGTTDASGMISITVPTKGGYSVKVSKNGYVEETFDVQVLGGSEQTEVILELAPVRLRLHVTVKDRSTNQEITGARVKIYKKGDVNGNLIGDDDTNSSGVASVTVPAGGRYVAVVTKDGYVSGEGEVNVQTGEANTYLTVKLEPEVVETEPPAVPCTLSLTVTDATNNNAVGGALVRIYSTANTGTAVAEGSSDNLGALSLTVPNSGSYVAKITKNGYIEDSFDIYVADGETQQSKTLQISPVMQSSEIRLVLTWGERPRDLDSHLRGTSGDGSGFHVYFSHKSASDGSGERIADLDLDDTSSYGPETTTIYDTSGSYEFYVHNYSEESSMADSGAVVKIYVGNSLYTTVEIGPGIEDEWQVCTIENGQVTVTNCQR